MHFYIILQELIIIKGFCFEPESFLSSFLPLASNSMIKYVGEKCEWHHYRKEIELFTEKHQQ